MNEKQIKKHRVIYKIIIFISVISSLRSLIIPLFADELTYLKLSENILRGQYYLTDNPTTITPIIPFIFAFFKTASYPIIGFVLNKLFNICLAVFGFRYLFLFLKKQNINRNIILALLTLVVVNPTSIAWFSTLYPEALIFFCFWGFIHYSTEPPKVNNLVKMLLLFILMVLARYVFAVLGVVVLITYYDYLKVNFKNYGIEILKYSILFLIPVLFWFKYVFSVEEQNLSGIRYLGRFKIENPILYNIKCGLGLEQHYEVNKVNGIPAFISLFVPITGVRNYIISIILIVGFIFGFTKKLKSMEIKKLFISIILIMLGFIIAGTGFSRYWLTLLPGFYLGYYYLFKMFNINDKWFIYLSQMLALIYVVNEIRLDIVILNKYL